MPAIDSFSYHCGALDCFNEMLHTGTKHFALSHPAQTREERDSYLDFCRDICSRYGTHFFLEDNLLITELFPCSASRGKYLILFYREDWELDEYRSLKRMKQELTETNTYEGEKRMQLALRWARLLSYPEESALRLIAENTEKESSPIH